jgi:hypothetical protein
LQKNHPKSLGNGSNESNQILLKQKSQENTGENGTNSISKKLESKSLVRQPNFNNQG